MLCSMIVSLWIEQGYHIGYILIQWLFDLDWNIGIHSFQRNHLSFDNSNWPTKSMLMNHSWWCKKKQTSASIWDNNAGSVGNTGSLMNNVMNNSTINVMITQITAIDISKMIKWLIVLMILGLINWNKPIIILMNAATIPTIDAISEIAEINWYP